MYSYSPIKSIAIKNFRNLGDVTLDFTDSPIISLIGENESGKTSVVKAFGVCAAHQSPKYQKYYIRTGTPGFGVAIELEDGTLVTRIKTDTANRYTVSKGDTVIWQAQKLESTVPKAVQDVMGLLEERETKELLQIRTYEDQLLFVITSASTNYKVMYEALKVKNISNAVKAGSVEANELKGKITAAERSCETLQESLKKIKLFDIGPMLNVRDRLQIDLDVLDRLDRAAQLCDIIQTQKAQLGVLNEIATSSISEIDETLVQSLDSAGRLIESIARLRNQENTYKTIEDLSDIDTTTLDRLNDAISRKEETVELREKSKAYIELVKAEPINEGTLALFGNAESTLASLESQKKMVSALDTSGASPITEAELRLLSMCDSVIAGKKQIAEQKDYEVQLVDYVDKVIAWMKSIGVATVDCPNCGEAVIIDLDFLDKTPQEV